MAGNLVSTIPTNWTLDWDQLSGSPGAWTASGSSLIHSGADTSGCASDAFAVTQGELLYVAATGSGSIAAGARFRVAFGAASTFTSGATVSTYDITTATDFNADGQLYDGFLTTPTTTGADWCRLVVYNLAAGACTWSGAKARRLSTLTAPSIKVEMSFGRASVYDNDGVLTWVVGAANTDNEVNSSFLSPRDAGTLDVVQWSDVTAATQSVSITRGRRTRTDEYETGQCTVVLDNAARDFDPLNTNAAADWVINGTSYVGTGRPVRVSLVDGDTAEQYPIFTGRATNWSPNWQGESSWVNVQAAEYAIELNKPVASTTYSAGLTSTVLGSMLDTLEWPSSLRNIDTGTVTTPQLVLSGSLLGSMRLLAVVELGRFYLDGSGNVRFRIGSTWRTANSQATFDPASTVGSFGLDYEQATIAYDLDLLRNRVAGTRYGGSSADSQVADDVDSIASYGTHGYEVTGLPFATNAEVATWAESVLAVNASPIARVADVEVWPLVNSAWWGLLMWGDFGDRYTVKVQLPPEGSDVITQVVQLESLRWDIRPNVEGGVRAVLGLVPAGT